MNFTRVNARTVLGASEMKFAEIFGEKLVGAYSASFISADENAVFGAAGLPFSAPIAVKALNTPAISCYLESIPAKSHLVVYGETLHHYTENGEIAIPQEIEVQLRSIYAAVCESAGKLDENGEKILVSRQYVAEIKKKLGV